jgi:N-acetylated-alpha-linked acidic dipeptidase
MHARRSDRAVRRRLFLLIATGLAVGLLAPAPSPAAPQADEPIPGFSPESSRQQARAEARFQRAVSAAEAGDLSRTISVRPQLIGTPGNRRAFDISVQTLRDYGLAVKGASYDVYISRPESIEVTMTAPEQRSLRVKEPPFPWQQYFDEVVVGYNAYSPSGDVTGQLVYANYGLPSDYEELEKLGVDVRGKIVIVRYGESFRGVKAKVAEEHGASGLIIYSDPEDDGFVRGPVFPEGPWKDANGIQRGSIEYIFEYPGDPLTPGEPSTPDTARLDPAQATNLPRIPTTPLSYGEAQHLLAAMGGPQAPEPFQGGLPFAYHVGPGPAEARLNLDIAYQQERVNNVIAVIPGDQRPDQAVVVGAHFDGWTYGTDDNTSGWTAVMQIGRGLGRLLERGWHPDRTIVLAGWDGEEYGLLGSVEWVEQLKRELRRDAVAYINMDGVGGREFGPSSVPSVDQLIVDVSKTVPAPGSPGTVFDAWTAEDPPEIDRLGSGSDYTAFLDHVGVPSLDLGFSTPGGEYHTSYDDTQMMERFLDPGYLGHQAAARMSGVTALRLAQADLLQFRYSNYAAEVERYVRELQAQPGSEIVDLEPLARQAQAWRAAATALEENATTLLASGEADSPRGERRLRRINRSLMRQERALTQPVGLAGRPWFKHMIYAPGRLTGYAAQFLPAIEDAINDGDAATAQRYRDLVLDSLERATELAERAG